MARTSGGTGKKKAPKAAAPARKPRRPAKARRKLGKSTASGEKAEESMDGAATVKTIAAAARAIEVHERTLKTWLSKGCPGAPGQYDVAAIAAWREVTLAQAGEDAGGERGKWETRKSRAAALKAELELAELQRRLIDVDAAARIVGQHAAEVKAHLEQLPDFALSLVKLAAGQKKTLRERLAAKVRDLCETFQRSLKELAGQEPDEEEDQA